MDALGKGSASAIGLDSKAKNTARCILVANLGTGAGRNRFTALGTWVDGVLAGGIRLGVSEDMALKSGQVT